MNRRRISQAALKTLGDRMQRFSKLIIDEMQFQSCASIVLDWRYFLKQLSQSFFLKPAKRRKLNLNEVRYL